MKITSINARVDSAGRHNDRNFDLNAAPHIDKARSAQNKYYTYNGDSTLTFKQLEMGFYKETFSKHINAQNKKNKEVGHKERNRDVKSYYADKYTRPEDKILQIGDMNEHVGPDTLWACALDYKDKFNALYGEHCKILDMALHVDEATPHVHIRRVWVAEDSFGHAHVSQNKALAALGVEAPDPSAKIDRWNNAKITFTYTDRELFHTVCKEHGLDIGELEQKTPPRKHLKDLEFKISAREKELEELVREKTSVQEELEELDKAINSTIRLFEEQPQIQTDYAAQLELIKKKNRAEKLKLLAEIYDKEINEAIQRAGSIERAVVRAEVDKEVKHLERFLDKKGLLEEYRESELSGGKEKKREQKKEPKKYSDDIF